MGKVSKVLGEADKVLRVVGKSLGDVWGGRQVLRELDKVLGRYAN